MTRRLNWGRLAALAIGGIALCWIVAKVGVGVIVRDIELAGAALPVAIAIHAVQLSLSGYAWRAIMGRLDLPFWRVVRIRWIREGVNTMLPAAQIGGQVVAVRLLERGGVPPALAVASTILDLAMEAVSQLVVIVAAALVLFALREGDRTWIVWVAGSLAATGLGVAGLALALRLGLLRLIERVLRSAEARWPKFWSLTGLHATLMARQADRGAMLRAVAAHSTSWMLGALEVWVILRALGHEVGLGPAFVIESLAMAARSAAFAVPGAVGVQEGGFVLACGLFGIGAEAAVALSVMKRLRELLVGVGALLAWQVEGRRVDRPRVAR